MCPKCGHELLIDQVTENGKYIYKCTNVRCDNYSKAFSLDGDEHQAAIQPKGDKKERA